MTALLTGCVLITFYTANHYNIPLNEWQMLKAGLLYGLAHILPYAVGATALRSLARQGARDISRVIVLFLVIAAMSSFCATWLVIPTLVISDMMKESEIAATWLPFWIGDMAGVMVLAPFFVGLLSRFLPGALFRLTDTAGLQQQNFSSRYLGKLVLNTLLLTFCMVLAKVTDSPNSAFAIFFLVIPHMWIACSESAVLNVTSVALSSFLIAFFVHLFDLMDHVMVYQFAINVIAANTLFGGDQAGAYKYAVSAITRAGESQLTDLSVAAISVGSDQSVDLNFTAGDANTVGYKIYRTEKDKTDKYYCIARISAAQLADGVDGVAAGYFRDKNYKIAGTEDAFLIDNSDRKSVV